MHLRSKSLAWLAPVWVLQSACNAASGQDAPPAFGGEGAQVGAPKQIPLSQAPPDAGQGPCAAPAPPSDTLLIDDFEDGDNKIFKGFRREGWLYVATDDTPGKAFPPRGDLRPVRLPADETSGEQQFAVHASAEGYSDWGVVWGTTLKWVGDGYKCPFNAAAFAGLRFRAKGKGSFEVKLGTLDTVPGEYEGRCRERCWDTHGKRITLSEAWQEHTIPWAQLQQQGWGAEARFDPERLLNLNFSAGSKDLPLEFWLDDLRFITAQELTSAVPVVSATPAPAASAAPVVNPPSVPASQSTQ